MEGTGLADVIPARGAAFGDIFNDGKIDVVINCMDHTPVLLRNVNRRYSNHWVGLVSSAGQRAPATRSEQRSISLPEASPARRCDERRQLQVVERPTSPFRTGAGDKGRRGRDSLAETAAVKHVSLACVDRYFAIEEGKGLVPSVYDAIAAEWRGIREIGQLWHG